MASPRPGRIPGLDGFRAVAILIVLGAHARLAPGPAWMAWLPEGGVLGVAVFFVLSGYLITTLLLDEQRRLGDFGRLDLPRFYARRALRLLPACYLFLLVMVGLRRLGWTSFGDLSLLASALYFRNFASAGDWPIAHTWSLSIEEQFYLLWPLALVIAHRRFGRRFGRRLLVLGALACAAAWPLVRLVRHHALYTGGGRQALEAAGMETILCGCLLALVLDAITRRAAALDRPTRIILTIVERALRAALTLPLTFVSLVGLYLYADRAPPAFAWALPPLRDAAIAVLLGACVLRPQRLATRLLDLAPLRALGVLSYSLYLWQEPFLDPDHGGPARAFPLNLVLSFACALASYFLVERPFLALRHRLRAKSDALPTVRAATS